jgi:phosphoribosylglycinamide formyltransferase-1
MKFVIIGSGTGSNAEAILKAWKAGSLGKAIPVAIFSDKPEARILKLGDEFGVPAKFLDPGKFKTKLTAETEAAYVDAIKATGADLVVLAGFMRVIHDGFLKAFPNQIINLHPSLLPSFKGLHAIEQAFDYGVKFAGCTVHYVTGDLDGGPILDQTAIRIEDNDTVESFTEKVHQAEHKLLPEVIVRLAEAHQA